jgi:hypothetical protein
MDICFFENIWRWAGIIEILYGSGVSSTILLSFNITVKIHGDISNQEPAHLGYFQRSVFDG